MKFTKTDSTSGPLVIVDLNQGEQIKTEAGSMVYHNGKVKLEGKKNGSFGGALVKSMFTGESFFITTATGLENGAVIGLAPSALGDIHKVEVGATQWRINDGAFLACDTTVETNSKSQGIGKALFGGTGGLVIMETSGQGDLLVNTFGAIHEVEVRPGEDLVVDNGHVVCWESTLNYDMKVASGMFGFTTGEGLVCSFSGQGKVLIQTRTPQNLAGLLTRFLPGK